MQFDLSVPNFSNFHRKVTSCLVVCKNVLSHPSPLPVTHRRMGLESLPTCYSKTMEAAELLAESFVRGGRKHKAIK